MKTYDYAALCLVIFLFVVVIIIIIIVVVVVVYSMVISLPCIIVLPSGCQKLALVVKALVGIDLFAYLWCSGIFFYSSFYLFFTHQTAFSPFLACPAVPLLSRSGYVIFGREKDMKQGLHVSALLLIWLSFFLSLPSNGLVTCFSIFPPT